MDTIFNTLSSSILHPGAGLVSAYVETKKSNKFGNTSGGMILGIIIIIILAIALWIMSLVATYRLTGSTLQVILCLLFGSIYLFFAWIYYGMTRHKLVKMTKA
jgi:hypothetical protein